MKINRFAFPHMLLATTALFAAEAGGAAAEAAASDALQNNVGKLSTKTMGLNGKKGAVLDKEGDVIWLGQIFGRATAVREKKRTSDSGDLIIDHPIVGSFEGTNLETGEVFTSAVLYLPGGFHDQMEQALKNCPDGSMVEFAVQLGAKKATNKAGFEWVGKNLLKPTGSDPIADLRDRVKAIPGAAKPKALAAPAKK